jgi:zinc protease
MEDLNAASMQDVQDWFKTNYGPNNVTLVIAGDITAEVAREKVEKYYGAITSRPPLASSGMGGKRYGTHPRQPWRTACPRRGSTHWERAAVPAA